MNLKEFRLRIEKASQKIRALPVMVPSEICISNRMKTSHTERLASASKKIRSLAAMKTSAG